MGVRVLNEEIKETILKYIRAGNHPAVAFAAAGISPNLYHTWKRRTENRLPSSPPDQEISDFYEQVEMAQAECEVEIVENLKTGLKAYPETALKFLSRRHPDRWGEKKEVRIKGGWVVRAAEMIRGQVVTWEVLEEELGPDLVGEVKDYMQLKSGTVVEGEVVESETKDDGDARP